MQYASRVNYNLDESDSIRFYSSRISESNAAQFVGCMRAQRGGFFIYPAEPADEDGNLLVRVEWHPPSGLANAPIDMSFSALNGQLVASVSIAPTGATPLDATRQAAQRQF